MRLICPNCDAQYEVAEDAIPEEGRDVQCSGCGHAWYQLSPALMAAQEVESELFDPAEMAPPALAVPSPVVVAAESHAAVGRVQAQSAAAPAPQPAPSISATRSLDEDALALLREEAEREVQARSREENRIEVQGDLGLDMATASAASRRAAQMRNLEAQAAAPLEAPVKPNKGRDLLPDIEEINSTLRPDVAGHSADEATLHTEAVKAGRRGFRLGFVSMLALAIAVVALYVFAPRISAAVPGLAAAMEGYVATVDALRVGLDHLMQRATAWLQA